MLNIPASVKTLFKTDGTRKNFRVHFPNGEFSDITNENIVREAVRFTESMCSQSTFRFGLSEASVIEFETVGIGNMYGCKIECAYEIDTSSLSAADISSIQSNPGDGTLVLAASSDLGYGFYRVPLGVFRVESCPRNHEAMTHRQVTAYGYPNTSSVGLSPAQMQIVSQLKQYQSTLSVDVFTFVASQIGFYTHGFIDAHYSRSAIGQWQNTASESLTFNSGSSLRILVNISYRENTQGSINKTDIRGFESNFDFGAVDNWINSNAPGLGFSASSIKAAKDAIGVWYSAQVPFPKIKETEVYCFFPYYAAMSGYRWRFPSSVTVKLQQSSGGSWTDLATHTETASALPVVYGFIPIGSMPSAEVSLDLGSLSASELLSGYLEVLGMYGKADRLGGLEISALDPSSPIAVVAGDYESCWWDEYDVSPVGAVLVPSADGDTEVTISSGKSVYNMTENEVMQTLTSPDVDTFYALLSGQFVSNVANIGFTPIEMTMRGLPWMEAGDALQITAQDGTVVDTYALRVEMSGIQKLTALITADGGEIVEG